MLHQRMVIIDGREGGSRIQLIPARDGVQHGSRVFHVARKRSDVIERAGERHQAVARYASIGWRNSYYAAEAGRLANGAAGIRAEAHNRGALCYGCCRSTARSARNTVERPRV